MANGESKKTGIDYRDSVHGNDFNKIIVFWIKENISEIVEQYIRKELAEWMPEFKLENLYISFTENFDAWSTGVSKYISNASHYFPKENSLYIYALALSENETIDMKKTTFSELDEDISPGLKIGFIPGIGFKK